MNDAPQLTDLLGHASSPMLAAAIGDALGWPIENRSGRVGGTKRVPPRLELVDWVRREGGGYAPHEVLVAAGSYSDDTQLTLAVGRSRLRGREWWQHWTDFELPMWLVYERGGGGASKRAAQAWNRGQAPWADTVKPSDRRRYFEAGGNGVAMRILPHVLVNESKGFEAIAADIFADGVCTHGHPRALVGALAHGYALWLAVSQERALGFGELVERTLGEEEQWGQLPIPHPQLADWESQLATGAPRFEETWEQTRQEMRKLLEVCMSSLDRGSLAVDRMTLETIGAFDKATNGAGTIAAAAAIFLASRYASQPSQGLTAAAFAKGADTDTIAAMTGALLGAIDRTGWLSSLRSDLQDFQYIEELAGRLGTGTFRARPVANPWRQEDRRKLWRTLEQTNTGTTLELPVFDECKVTHSESYFTKSSNSIREWTLQSLDGLTLFVKHISATKSDSPAGKPSLGAPPSAWLVRQVTSLTSSGRFYSQVIGLPTRIDSNRDRLYVSDRLVLEAAKPGSKPPGVPASERELLACGEAITLFRNEREFEQMHKRLMVDNIPVSRIFDRDGHRAFRCSDPDGYVIELRAELS